MIDREKIFKGLETCSQKTVLYVCGSCPYNNDYNNTYDCTQALSEDSFALLKDQQKQIEELEERIAIMMEGQPEIVRCNYCFYAEVAPDDNSYFFCTHLLHRLESHGSHYYCADGLVKGNCSEFPNSSVGS